MTNSASARFCSTTSTCRYLFAFLYLFHFTFVHLNLSEVSLVPSAIGQATSAKSMFRNRRDGVNDAGATGYVCNFCERFLILQVFMARKKQAVLTLLFESCQARQSHPPFYESEQHIWRRAPERAQRRLAYELAIDILISFLNGVSIWSIFLSLCQF